MNNSFSVTVYKDFTCSKAIMRLFGVTMLCPNMNGILIQFENCAPLQIDACAYMCIDYIFSDTYIQAIKDSLAIDVMFIDGRK